MAKLPSRALSPVLRVAIGVPLYRLFDYLPPANVEESRLLPGIRVEVTFGRSKKIGYVAEISRESDLPIEKLKPVEKIVDDSPLLSAADLALIQWASGYYHHPIGEVFESAFPAALRKGQAVFSPAPATRYVLTECGLEAQQERLKRTPRQLQLFMFFQQFHPQALTERDLKNWHNNWRVPVNALVAKALIRPAADNAVTPQQYYLHGTDKAGQTANVHDPVGEASLLPNSEQQSAIDSVIGHLHAFAVFLLEGVTGSGKTEVYMQIIRSVLEHGKQVLVLVPEINLTPQLEQRFRQRFPVAMALSHSGLTDKQRLEAWVGMQTGAGSILLGTRSALFTPLKNPGLIILDEEHDSSFKQQEGFRFSARDAAIMRGKLLGVPVLLGSATPSLESLHNANLNRYRHLRLTKRAGSAVEPAISLLDIRNKKLTGGLSGALVEEIANVLQRNEQAMLFLNRRGFAPTLICHGCGWVARCKNCDANLVIHHLDKRLRCHHCSREQPLPVNCPACKTGELMALGLGTEQLEAGLQSLFPGKTIVRLDRDTTQRKGTLERFLQQINEGRADIILGTQMLAKGHHFQNVTLVAIVDVDGGLFSIDYRATERLAQMIVQVSGRAGRAEKKGRVILQTRQPSHPVLNTLIREGYRQYAGAELEERKQACLPPFAYQALFRAHADSPGLPCEFLNKVAGLAQKYAGASLHILGPVSAPMEKRARRYHYQLLLQDGNRNALQQCLAGVVSELANHKASPKIRWSLDVDPLDLY